MYDWPDENIDLIINSQQSILATRTNNLARVQLTQADINLLKLVESTQRELKNKQFHYKELERISKFSEDVKTKTFIQNFINGDKGKTVRFERRYLGSYYFLLRDTMLSFLWLRNVILHFLR